MDIERLETSLSLLQESLTSLAEVAMQNRRDIDFIFLQQAGLYAALGEECCFYIGHLSVIKESMAKVRGGLARWGKDREASQPRMV